MIFLTHLLVGLVLGMLVGHPYLVAFAAIFIDFDHVFFLINKSNSWKEFYEILVDPEDRKGSPRGFLHSILGWFILSIAFYIVGGELGIYFSIGYLSHIILDMLDESPFEIAYPFKADFRGFIRYNSWLEYLIILALIVILIRL